MLIKLGVAAVLGNRPMPVGQVTVVVPGVENQDTHESRSGVMRSTLPLVVRDVSRCVRFYEVGRRPYTRNGNAALCGRLCGQCRGEARWMIAVHKSDSRFSLFRSASLVRLVSNVQNGNTPQNSGYENKAG